MNWWCILLLLLISISACTSGGGGSESKNVYESEAFFKRFANALSTKKTVLVPDILDAPADEVCIVKESDEQYQAAFDSYLKHRDYQKLQEDQEQYTLAYVIVSFKYQGQIVKYYTKNGTYLMVNGNPVSFLDKTGKDSRYIEFCAPSHQVSFWINADKTFIVTTISGKKPESRL